jgi:hypothetical protein
LVKTHICSFFLNLYNYNNSITGNNIDFNKWYDDVTIMAPNLFNHTNFIMNTQPYLFVCIFDLPQRAKSMNMINHAGYFACINCETKGEYEFNKVYYPFIKKLKNREIKSYESCLKIISQKKTTTPNGDYNTFGIKGPSALSKNINIMQDVVYDYMHLCCEGYIKRFIKLIFTPPNKKRKLQVSTEYYIGYSFNFII